MGESVIKWKKGRPEETGSYLVSVGRGFVTTDYWYCLKGKWQYWEGEVIAWCKLDDIEAYKGG